MDNKKLSNLKPIVSVSEMAKMLNLSRSRLYQLLDLGILPKPIQCQRTKRPYFTQELQQQCLNVKETNVGANGQYILFYSPRKNTATAKKTAKKINPIYSEFTDTLNSMGLDTTPNEVQKAIEELYPDGIDGIDGGVVIREIFRHLKSK
jgi:hypothetical protein